MQRREIRLDVILIEKGDEMEEKERGKGERREGERKKRRKQSKKEVDEVR